MDIFSRMLCITCETISLICFHKDLTSPHALKCDNKELSFYMLYRSFHQICVKFVFCMQRLFRKWFLTRIQNWHVCNKP